MAETQFTGDLSGLDHRVSHEQLFKRVIKALNFHMRAGLHWAPV